ncbi:MAG TPA: DUF3788 domain-containing protein [Ignavibacteriales bacterium]|nr:DUF3788 domain-containing protein [Ignavibacteriales bacterium]
MNWQEIYLQDNKPTIQQIGKYVNSPFWNKLNDDLAEAYSVEPQIEYSCCSMQKGWNVKYKKNGRSLCTLYPTDNNFIALVVIGKKEQMEAEFVITGCGKYVRNLFDEVPYTNGAKWLMIEVKNKTALRYVENLIAVRAKQK